MDKVKQKYYPIKLIDRRNQRYIDGLFKTLYNKTDVMDNINEAFGLPLLIDKKTRTRARLWLIGAGFFWLIIIVLTLSITLPELVRHNFVVNEATIATYALAVGYSIMFLLWAYRYFSALKFLKSPQFKKVEALFEILRSEGELAEGTIINVERISRGYKLFYTFMTNKREQIDGVFHFSSNRLHRFTKGDHIMVLYYDDKLHTLL